MKQTKGKTQRKRRPPTCEWCRFWRATLVGFGKVAMVCCQTQSLQHYMMQTGAGSGCGYWSEKGTNEGRKHE